MEEDEHLSPLVLSSSCFVVASSCLLLLLSFLIALLPPPPLPPLSLVVAVADAPLIVATPSLSPVSPTVVFLLIAPSTPLLF